MSVKETALRFSIPSLSSRLVRLACAGATLVAGTLFLGSNDTQTAIANGDTRTISFYHTHRKDQITVTFKRGGYYDRSALAKLNYFLRDWRNDKQTTMDPRLFDVVWEAYSEVGYKGNIHIVSAFRSPETNAMLRRRSRGVAKHSQHTLGKAMDTTVPGLAMSRVREVGMRLQMGGVGFYPRSNTPFVHLDVGNVRAWPRMSRAQLARLFPDGRTVHLPREGGTMPGYQLALADIQRYGRGVGGAEGEDGDGSRSSFGALFGSEGGGSSSGEQDNSPLALALRDQRRANGTDQPVQVASAEPAPAPRPERKARPAVPAEAPKIAAQPEPMVEPATVTPSATPRKTPAAEADVQIALGEPQILQPKIIEDASSIRIPMPPRRPANLDELNAVAGAADVPMPPQRPGAIMALAMTDAGAIPAAQPGEDVSGAAPELGPAATLNRTTTGSAPKPLDEPVIVREDGSRVEIPAAKGKKEAPPPLRIASLPAEADTSLARSLVATPKASSVTLPAIIGESEAANEESVPLADVPLPPVRPASMRVKSAVAKLPEELAKAEKPLRVAARSDDSLEAPAKAADAPALRIRPSKPALAAKPKPSLKAAP